MREPCSTSTAVWNLEETFHSALLLVSSIHATREQLTAHEREGAYIVKSEVLSRFLSWKFVTVFQSILGTLRN